MRYTILPSKLMYFILVIMVCFNLVSCTILKKDSALPDDFYFIIEGGNDIEYTKPLLDTKNKKIGRDLTIDYVEVDYYISDVDLNKIYNNIVKYNINDLNNDIIYKPEDMAVIPQYCYKLEFKINNTIYSIMYDNSLHFFKNKKMRNLIKFHEYIIKFYTSTEEYHNLPEPSIFIY